MGEDEPVGSRVDGQRQRGRGAVGRERPGGGAADCHADDCREGQHDRRPRPGSSVHGATGRATVQEDSPGQAETGAMKRRLSSRA